MDNTLFRFNRFFLVFHIVCTGFWSIVCIMTPVVYAASETTQLPYGFIGQRADGSFHAELYAASPGRSSGYSDVLLERAVNFDYLTFLMGFTDAKEANYTGFTRKEGDWWSTEYYKFAPGYPWYTGNDKDWLGWNQEWRGFVEWNMTALPDDADIHSASLTIYCTGSRLGDMDDQGTTFDVRHMSYRPSVTGADRIDNESPGGAANNLFNDAGDGTRYVGSWTIITMGYYTKDLASALSDIQASLTSNWFAIGMDDVTDEDQGAEFGKLDFNVLNLDFDSCTMSDIYETNNTCVQAKTIDTAGTLQHHWFCQTADEDWLVFTIIAGVTYTINTDDHTTDADTFISLYDACGGSLLDSDDSSSPTGAKIVYVAPETGVRYIKVENRSSTFGLTSDYYIWIKPDVYPTPTPTIGPTPTMTPDLTPHSVPVGATKSLLIILGILTIIVACIQGVMRKS